MISPRRSTLLLVCALLGAAATAHGQSMLTLRGNYWRDQNTRVLAPEALLRKELPHGTVIEASYLLDAITSASASAGVLADQPFTELRNEIGVRVQQRVGPATFFLNYRYSTESDYWAHTGGGGAIVDLLQKNLTLGANYTISRQWAARRVSAIGYVWANGTQEQSALTSHIAILTASQVLSRWALGELGYELRVDDGFQGNHYRTVKVAGSPVREDVPDRRYGHTAVLGVRMTPLYHRGALSYLTIHLKYRFYYDDWGVIGNTPEVRIYAGISPVELRLTARYHTETAATFAAPLGADGRPAYDVGYRFPHCPAVQPDNPLCAAGDPKLYGGGDFFLEGRLLFELRALDSPRMPLGSWLGRGTFALSFGHVWFTGYNATAFGPEAWVGGLELTLPL